MNTSILLLILALIGIGSYLLGSRRAVLVGGSAAAAVVGHVELPPCGQGVVPAAANGP